MEPSTPNEYEQQRRSKLQKLRELGVNPYGKRTEGLAPLAQIREKCTAELTSDTGPIFKCAGRIVLKRDLSKKLSFYTLQDESGQLQIALDMRRLNELDWKIRDLLDTGDQIVVSGNLAPTKTGEPTIWAKTLEISSKALVSPPAKHEGLQDVELRYRQRYVDLWANPDVMKMMKLRSKIIEEIRSFLHGRGFTEVETPMMQTLHGGAAARPFETHHNALDTKLYMRIAPELFLKRLLVGGFTKVFELNRNFRNEGISPRHNPEFTMLEIYEAYGSWETMAELVESMICDLAEKLLGGLKIAHPNGRTIDLTRPWRRAPMANLVREATGIGFTNEPLASEQITAVREKNSGKDLKLVGSPAEQLVELYEKLVEPTLINPTFVTRVPSVVIPLARKCEDDPFFADVYELAINGQEISPGYSELNDPDIQAVNFTQQVGDEAEKQKTDEDFLNALKVGMPPAGGLGLGIDRLIMLLTGAESIRDVILFPLMRPVGQNE